MQPMHNDAEHYAESFRAFSGQGNRLDGKTKNTESSAAPIQPHEIKRYVRTYPCTRGSGPSFFVVVFHCEPRVS